MGNVCDKWKKIEVNKCAAGDYRFHLPPTNACPEAYCIGMYRYKAILKTRVLSYRFLFPTEQKKKKTTSYVYSMQVFSKNV